MINTTMAGNLTRDPEIRYTREGQPTASFGLAVNRRWQHAEAMSGKSPRRSSTWCAGVTSLRT